MGCCYRRDMNRSSSGSSSGSDMLVMRVMVVVEQQL